MGTQYVYSRSLAGFLFLVALVAPRCGGCGETVAKDSPTFEPAQPESRVVNPEGVAGESDEGTLMISDEPGPDMAEASVLGYSDPEATEATCTPSLTEDGCTSEQPGDTDDGCSDTPSMTNWGEDGRDVVKEESNVEMNESGEAGECHDGMYDETPWTPTVTEQEYAPEPMGDGDDGGSDVVAPYIDGEDGTGADGNSLDVTSDSLGTATRSGMGWTWVNDVRLLLHSWWQAMITVPKETETPRYEAHIPSMSSDVETGESGNDARLGP